jgi:hypothetical protein
MKRRKLRIEWSVAWGITAVLLIVLWIRSYWASATAGQRDHLPSDEEMIALFDAKSGEFREIINLLNNEAGPLVISTDGEIAVWDTSEHGAELHLRPRQHGGTYISLSRGMGLSEVSISPLRSPRGLVEIYEFHPHTFCEGPYWRLCLYKYQFTAVAAEPRRPERAYEGRGNRLQKNCS